MSEFKSTDDARTGNSLRGNYRKLTNREAALVDDLKAMGDEFMAILQDAEPAYGGREFSIAKTKIEEAVMWAVKGVTK